MIRDGESATGPVRAQIGQPHTVTSILSPAPARASTAARRPPWFPFASLWRHRDLIRQFAWRYIEQRHRGSFLGIVWMVLTPLLMLGLYTFVFGFVFQGSFGVAPNEGHLDYALALLVGLVAYHFLAEVLATSSSLIVANPNFVKKVVFPLEILPAAAVLAAVLTSGVSLALALLGILLLGEGLTVHALQALLVLPPLLMIALGCSWFLAALGVFVRDTSSIMPFLVQILLYTSAIFYPLTKIPASIWQYLQFNPLLHIVELLRQALLWHRPVDLVAVGWLWVAGVVLCWLGYALFVRAKPAFADVL